MSLNSGTGFKAVVVAMALATGVDASGSEPAASTGPTGAGEAAGQAFVVVAVDQTTPRGALKVLTQALDMGDVETIRRVLLVESPQQQAWADAMIALSQATGRLQKQAVATFGAEGARALVGDTAGATMLAMAQLDTFTEELDEPGLTATVRSGFADERPMVVKKIDGRWRVPVDSFTGGAPADQLRDVAARLERQAAAIVQVVEDVAAGKLATPESAGEALQRRQLEAVLQPATTAPASTRPSAG